MAGECSPSRGGMRHRPVSAQGCDDHTSSSSAAPCGARVHPEWAMRMRQRQKSYFRSRREGRGSHERPPCGPSLSSCAPRPVSHTWVEAHTSSPPPHVAQTHAAPPPPCRASTGAARRGGARAPRERLGSPARHGAHARRGARHAAEAGSDGQSRRWRSAAGCG